MDDVTQSCGCQRICRCEPEGEEPPTCACGEPITRGTECECCAYDRAVATIDWREAEAAE
jgi:hypothetical protein